MIYEEEAARLLEQAATRLRRRYRFINNQMLSDNEKCRHCREPRSTHLKDGSDRCSTFVGSDCFSAVHCEEVQRLGRVIDKLETVIDELEKVPQ